ncbi:Fc.00g025150.m01.CDS01 [Cosmosporella sp. VM-42]
MSSDSRPLALVTGATQGIGLAVAKILASKHSYRVLLDARDVKAGEKIVSELREARHEASVIQLDLSSQSSIEAAIATIERDYGYLDVLVNNAGILLDFDASLSKWELYNRTFTINVIGTGVLTEGLVPLLLQTKVGPPRIVFVSSTMGSLEVSQDKSTPWYNIDYKAYDASKAAVNMLTINFSRVLESAGGKVNSVCPGYINTGLTRNDQRGETPEAGATRIVEMSTLGQDGPTGTFSSRLGPVRW